MRKKLILLFFLMTGTAVIRILHLQFSMPPGGDATLTLGFILLAAYISGLIVRRLGAPMITGYILGGIFFGPWLLPRIDPLLTFISLESIDQLRLIDQVALGLIAFSAGGELRLRALKNNLQAITSITCSQTIICFSGVWLCFYFGSSYFSLTSGLDTYSVAAISMLLAITTVAKSPATTIAVINEYKARGTMTDIILGVTIVKDVVVISLFSLCLATAGILVSNTQFDSSFILQVSWEITGSVIVGFILGSILIRLLVHVEEELATAIILLGFTAQYLAEMTHLSGLLICMVAGFVVENLSSRGHCFIEAIERYSLPVYVVFFTLAGAALNLNALLESWRMATLLVVLRLFFTWMATTMACRWSNCPSATTRYAWTGFIGQAGVTLGLALLIETRFPEFGTSVKAIIVGAIAINQIIGPVIFRIGLTRSGEVSIDQTPHSSIS